jgi:hypothetical protein
VELELILLIGRKKNLMIIIFKIVRCSQRVRPVLRYGLFAEVHVPALMRMNCVGA